MTLESNLGSKTQKAFLFPTYSQTTYCLTRIWLD